METEEDRDDLFLESISVMYALKKNAFKKWIRRKINIVKSCPSTIFAKTVIRYQCLCFISKNRNLHEFGDSPYIVRRIELNVTECDE